MKKLSIIYFSIVLLIMCLASHLNAHEVRPGYLDLRQTGPETYNILWKVPARGDMRLGLYVKFPKNCELITPRTDYQTMGSLTERYTIACRGGLTGHTIIIDGLPATLTDVLVRLERLDGTTQITRLTPSRPSFIVEAVPNAAQVAVTYLRLGVEHILTGIDHLLFVLALLILVKGGKRLLGTITAFTVAHSITLAVATLGFAHISQQPVEAIIALSIVFVACEIIHSNQGQSGLTKRSPWIVAFVFGLLHGFGFAGALKEVGLPQKSIPLALFLFNVGVELGQIIFVSFVLALGAVLRRITARLPVWMLQMPAYGIGIIASYWTIERVIGFLLVP